VTRQAKRAATAIATTREGVAGGWRRVAAASLAVLAAALAAPAQAAQTTTIGGPGGSPFHLRCGAGRFLVGLSGRAGNWMDHVAPICVRMMNGRWIEAPSFRNGVGGPGGGPFTTMCPPDSVVTDYYGYALEYVYNIALLCRHDGPNGSDRLPSVPAAVGGTLDVATSASGGCGTGAAADGIIGGAGLYVDRFGLSCGTYLGRASEPVVPKLSAEQKVLLPPIKHGGRGLSAEEKLLLPLVK